MPAWLSLDSGDNDPSTFLSYFIAALQIVDPNIGQSVTPLLQISRSPSLQELLVLLLNEISSKGVQYPIAIALDDYHLIESPQIHGAINILIDHLPESFRLILSARADPPLSLARLRARNQLVEIRANDLRFTTEETREFLNQTMRLKLSSKDVYNLGARTEGWITGLQLAAISIHGQKDPSTFIASFSGKNRYITDYLFDEVFNRLPAITQSFLLQTSILNRFCESLCEALIEKELNGDNKPDVKNLVMNMLYQLDQTNLFLVPLDDMRHWYRYHHLFQDFLRQRLQNDHAGLVPELNRRASSWYEQRGFAREAIDHALAAAEFERAAGLIDGAAEGWIARGEIATLLEKLAGLPEAVTSSSPNLCIWNAWAFTLSRHLDEAEPWLQRAEDYFLACKHQAERDDENRSRHIWNYRAGYGQVIAIRATIAQERHDSRAAISFAERALELLPRNDLVLPSAMALTLGEAYLSQIDAVRASTILARAIEDSLAARHFYIYILALIEQAKAQAILGNFSSATEIYELAVRFSGENELGHLNQIAGQALEEFNRSRDIEQPRLNEREIEILRLLATGLSNQEIADRLAIAISTVRWYIKRIYRKLSVHNRTQATYLARNMGFL